MKPLIALCLVIPLLNGCQSMKPQDFARQSPPLDIFEYFLGHTRAWGLFEDRFGNVRRQFTVDIRGQVEDGRLVLQEDFLYSDGEREQRRWTIERAGEGRYRGRAGDVIGEALGIAAGNSLNWRYRMALKVGDGHWRVAFDDWMFLQPDGVLINRARVSKFGIELGTVSLFFMKPGPAQPGAADTSR